MAQSSTWTRRINLYINGKEIKNDVKSIRGEMQKAIAVQSKMTIGSAEYNAQTKKIQILNGILKQHRAQLHQAATGWGALSGAADKFNKYFGMIGAAVASFTGVVFGLRKAADAFNQFEERLDNLSALTGLEGDNLQWLGDQAKEMSVKTTEAGIKIKQSATDIEDAFTLVGSQRPELLKNKEALAAVTEDAIILSEAAKDKLEPSAHALTNTLNQFNLTADQSRRVINTLAAGSKEGAANVPYLSQAIEKMGTSYALMGGEVESAVGIIEAVAPKFKQAELAGNSLDKILLKMKAKQIGYKNGVFDMNLALLELETRFKKGESATDIFGVEHAKMAEVLVQARAEVQRYTQAVTGTSVAEEQARKNTNNRAAELAQAKNRVTLLAIELGEQLSPAMTKSVLGFSALLKVAIKLPQIIKDNQTILIALTGALIAYNAHLIRATALQAAKIAMDLREKAVNLAVALIATAKVVAMKAYIAVTGQATVANRRFIDSQIAFGRAMSISPLGAAIAGLTALYLAIKTYDKYNADAMRREREKKIAVENLTKVNGELKKSYDDINKQIGKLNTLSIQEKQDLREKISETINLAKAELELKKARREELHEDNKKLDTWEKIQEVMMVAANSGSSGLGPTMNISQVKKQSAAVTQLVDTWKEANADEAVKEYDEQIEKLNQQMIAFQRQREDLDEILNAEAFGDKIGTETLANLEEKLSKYQLALKNAAKGGEDFLRIQQKINQVQKEMEKFSPDVTSKDEEKSLQKLQDAKKKAEEDLAKKIKEIRRQLRLSEMNDEAAELQSIRDRYADMIAVAKQYGIDTAELNELMARELAFKEKEQGEKRAKLRAEVEQKIFEVTANMRDRAVNDVRRRYDELIAMATKFGIDTTELYAQMMEELQMISEEHFPDEKDIFGMTQENWDNLMANIEMVLMYMDQIGQLWGSINKIQDNKDQKEMQRYEKNTKRKKNLLNDQLENGILTQEEYNAKSAKLDSELDQKKAEIQRRSAERSKKLRMFEAAISTAAAIIHMLHDPGGYPGIGLSVLAGITGAMQIAAIANEPVPAYAVGGFTSGDRIYRAGEAGTEWIGNNKMVNDPYTGPVIAALESVQRGKAPASIFSGAIPAFSEMQAIPAFAHGGFSNGMPSSQVVNNYHSTNSDALLNRLDLLLEENRMLRIYMSDPDNRRAFIDHSTLNQQFHEDTQRNDLGRIG